MDKIDKRLCLASLTKYIAVTAGVILSLRITRIFFDLRGPTSFLAFVITWIIMTVFLAWARPYD
jgi:hypothetical protein